MPLYPEDRSCTAPTATRVFDHLVHSNATTSFTTDTPVQTFQPQLTALHAQLLDLLDVPASAYTSGP